MVIEFEWYSVNEDGTIEGLDLVDNKLYICKIANDYPAKQLILRWLNGSWWYPNTSIQESARMTHITELLPDPI